MSKVTYNGVNHLAMATGDMDLTIRFWRDLLGMKLVAGLGSPVAGTIFSRFQRLVLLPFLSGHR